MRSLQSSSVGARAALLYVIVGAGCAEDLRPDGAGADETQPIVTEPTGENAFVTRVDASDAEVWVYFSFVSGGEVIPLDPADSPDWDLGFQRFHIISNGGASGSGGARVAVLSGQTLDAVLTPPEDGYLADQPDGDDSDTVVDSAFADGDGWYDYDETTNRLSPRDNVYVVETARGAHYALSILGYYDDAGSSGHPSFAWSEL